MYICLAGFASSIEILNKRCRLSNEYYRQCFGSSASRFLQICTSHQTSNTHQAVFQLTTEFLDEELPEDPQLLHPVFVTPEENKKYNDISRMSKDVILGTVLHKIESISCNEVRKFFLSRLESDIKNTIVTLVNFSYDIDEYLQEQPDNYENVDL